MHSLDDLIQRSLAAIKSKDLLATELLLNQADREFPRHPIVLYLMAQLRLEQKRVTDAQALLESVVALQPEFTQGWQELVRVYRHLKNLTAMCAALESLFQLKPVAATALEIASIHHSEGKKEKALTYYQYATHLDPNNAKSWYEQGAFLHKCNVANEAIVCFEKARALEPKNPKILKQLASCYQTLGAFESAQRVGNELVATEPTLENRIEAILCAPIIADSSAQLNMLHTETHILMQELSACEPSHAPAASLNIKGLFYLSYNGLDNREIKEMLASICRTKYTLLSYHAPNLSALPVVNRKIRIGFISTYFHHHTIGKLFHGIIASLDKSVFEVYVFAITPETDFMAEMIKASADHYWAFGHHFLEVRDIIASQSLDILNYTDLCMDNFTYQLAFARLAPVQCVYWGHPETTGIDTVDYYISSGLIEPPDAQAQYSEKLVLLPQLPMVYDPPKMQTECAHPQVLALKQAGRNLYVCPQSLFKMHPEFDSILASILRKDPQSVLVLIGGFYEEWTALLKTRFAKTISDVLTRIVFLPRLSESDFLHLLCMADVVLDSFYFGGGNSTFEALTLGCPIVTWPGPFMRGRVTHGCYQMMGVDALVAKTPEEYVEIAIRVANDKTYQSQLRERIKSNAHKLMDGMSAMESLEAFFKDVCSNVVI
jgi:predicted O-linked N-acetylglucosamine transferase (SPINDLY family)